MIQNIFSKIRNITGTISNTVNKINFDFFLNCFRSKDNFENVIDNYLYEYCKSNNKYSFSNKEVMDVSRKIAKEMISCFKHDVVDKGLTDSFAEYTKNFRIMHSFSNRYSEGITALEMMTSEKALTNHIAYHCNGFDMYDYLHGGQNSIAGFFPDLKDAFLKIEQQKLRNKRIIIGVISVIATIAISYGLYKIWKIYKNKKLSKENEIQLKSALLKKANELEQKAKINNNQQEIKNLEILKNDINNH